MNIKDAWRVLWHGLPPERIKIEQVELTYDVLRHQLGSINLTDLKAARAWTENERADHNSEMAVIHQKKGFKLEIDNLKDAQAYFTAEQAQDNRQLDFARGTMNGIALVWERIEQLAGEHLNKTKPKEGYDPYGTVPETPIHDILNKL